ncbi:D-alanine--D-alanine ligase [Patescibacteria group bacterium]|nr:D-alanine--D-alanine ligase [Patescibacteria group bacterium]
MKKIALFFGGLGNEAEVSIISAQNIVNNFDYKRQRLVLIYWHQDGYFYKLSKMEQVKSPQVSQRLDVSSFKKYFNLALLMTHGRFGEDGVLQGVLESQKIPYSGCGVLSSALCMDKAVFKLLMTGQKIPQVPYFLLDFGRNNSKEREVIIDQSKKQLTLPVFVKPANSGSSVGISKVDKWNKLASAIKLARRHDTKILIEQGVKNVREIEVAVLGNEKLEVSLPGELGLGQSFYDYDEKYKKGRTEMMIPAPLSHQQIIKIQALAKQIYILADCRGFARIDFFIEDKEIYLNEINTLPGFTDISMYPQLMMNNGYSYTGLINKLIDLAV